MKRRDFLAAAGATGLVTALPATGATAATGAAAETAAQPASGGVLRDMTAAALPISVAERQARVAKAQRLMRDHGIEALLLEAGSALVYFTGVRWWRSERYTGAIIPKKGDIAFVTPYFEEPSVRESISFGDDVRTWHEHENPFALVAGILKDRGLKSGTIGVEASVRHFIVDGVSTAAPRFRIAPAEPVTRGCRMFKSPAEIALMQVANDVTMAAYRHVHARIEPGMAAGDIGTMMNDATRRLGGEPVFASVLLNEASAYPHGTSQPQTVREGGIVLMDCGCSVHDYQSDISRTWVCGEATARQRDVWNTVKRGQALALETAAIGTPAGNVDDVVRRFYESKGYGPGYRTPGLSHRLGHGIGMDGHEPVNFVHGENTALAPGMCFSNEPGIYLFGEFGVRLEDCLYMSDDGPRLFSALSPSIDAPFG